MEHEGFKGVTEEVDIPSITPAQAGRDGIGQDGDVQGVQGHEPAEYHVHGKGVCTGQDDPEAPGRPPCGAVPFHGNDRVHHLERRLEHEVQVNQHPCKAPRLLEPGVEEWFFEAGNEAEEVLGPAGEQGQDMGLGLGDYNNMV
jgi:hypothetical protein